MSSPQQVAPRSHTMEPQQVVGVLLLSKGGLDEAQPVSGPQFPHLHGGALQKTVGAQYMCFLRVPSPTLTLNQAMVQPYL